MGSDRTKRTLRLGLMTLLVIGLVAPIGATAKPRMQKLGAERVSMAADAGGEAKISGWATFSGQHMGSTEDPKDDAVVAAAEGGQAAAEEEGGEVIGSDFIYRPENEDFFWRIEVTKIPTLPLGIGGVPVAGGANTLYGLQLSIKGVSFEIRAHRLGSLDPDNPTGNAFGLFKCEGETACTFIAPLKGGYGTTGERVVVALPLSVVRQDGGVDVQEGDPIGELIAYTAIGQFATGAIDQGLMDSARLIKDPRVDIPKKSVHVTVGKMTKPADLKDGYFNASFPASLFRKSPTTVKTKTCLGKECVKQSFKFKS